MLGIGNCFLPLPPVTVAGVSVVLGGVSAEGVAGVLVVSVSGVGDTPSFLPSFLPFLRLLNIRLICSGHGSPLVAGGVLGEGVAGVGDTLGLGFGNCFLPLPPVAGVGVGGVSVSAEGVTISAEGVAVVSVVFTTTVAGVSVSGVLGVVLVSSTRCEGVAGVGDTLGFLLGDRNS